MLRRCVILLSFAFITCGDNRLEIWYYLGEIHDYHFRQSLNKTWRRVNVSILRKEFSSVNELEESLKVRKPDLALIYPSTLKDLIKKGELVKITDKNIIPDYCEGYCFPIFKSFVGFYINEELAKQVNFPLNFKIEDLLNLNTDYIVFGIYPSATLYTALLFTYLSEGYDTLQGCVKVFNYLRELAKRPYVRIYPDPRMAEMDMVLMKIVSIVGTSAYKPYIEREGVSLTFLPLINSKGEKVYFLSGPDFVVFRGGNVKKSKEFLNVINEVIKNDTIWQRFGYYHIDELKRFGKVFHDLKVEFDRVKLRNLAIKALNPTDTLNYDIEGLCKDALMKDLR